MFAETTPASVPVFTPDDLWNEPEPTDFALILPPPALRSGDNVSVYVAGQWVDGMVILPEWRDHDANRVEYRGVLVVHQDGMFVNRHGRAQARYRKALVNPFLVLKATTANAAVAEFAAV